MTIIKSFKRQSADFKLNRFYYDWAVIIGSTLTRRPFFLASANKPASVCLLHSPMLCLNYEINNRLRRVLTAGKNYLIVTGTALTQPLRIGSSTLKPTRLNAIALICSLQVKNRHELGEPERTVQYGRGNIAAKILLKLCIILPGEILTKSFTALTLQNSFPVHQVSAGRYISPVNGLMVF